MKSFSDYYYEKNKQYEYSIKLANVEPSKEVVDRIRYALEMFKVESIGQPKSIPIQEHTEFPNMGPVECYTLDVALKYPSTPDKIEYVISDRARLPKQQIVVRTRRQADIAQEKIVDNPKGDALLLDTELAAESAQEAVGQQRVDNFLQNLAKDAKVRAHNIAGKDTTKYTSTNELPLGTTSPVGSRQNKIPSPVKGN